MDPGLVTAGAGGPVLCLNTGSSSIKAALYDASGSDRVVIWRGSDGTGNGGDQLAGLLERAGAAGAQPVAVGHRIVHGGPWVTDHALLDAEVRARLDDAVPFAPLHLPPALAVVDAVQARWPDRPQVACLDTAFHRTLPEVAHRYALPADVVATGVRRYGFHGLSCEYVVGAVPDLGRGVIAHLGNGASLTAVLDGRSVDTTMGLTPLGGVVMGTRVGDLDPGVVLHLARTSGLDPDGLEELLDRRSGLLGLSGATNDVRTLLERRTAGDAGAALALAVFVRSVAKAAAGLAVALGGLDTLVFTGGIGEHADPVRSEVVEALAPVGLGADRVRVLVVPTDEESVMARHTAALVAPPAA